AAVAVPVAVCRRGALARCLAVLPAIAVGAAVGGRVSLEGERRAGQRVILEGTRDGRRRAYEPGEHGQVPFPVPHGVRPGGAPPPPLRGLLRPGAPPCARGTVAPRGPLALGAGRPRPAPLGGRGTRPGPRRQPCRGGAAAAP